MRLDASSICKQTIAINPQHPITTTKQATKALGKTSKTCDQNCFVT